jgi:hypothetical protein
MQESGPRWNKISARRVLTGQCNDWSATQFESLGFA